MNVHEFQGAHSTLRGDPRYEALLNDPAKQRAVVSKMSEPARAPSS